MKKPYLNFTRLTAVLLFFIVAIVINSCKKDNQATTDAVLPQPIAQAKNWY